MLTTDMLNALVTGGVGVIGTTLFEGIMPDACSTGVALNQYAGGPPLWVAGVESPGLQAIVRAPKYADAQSLAMSVMHVLGDLANATPTVGGARYLQVDERSSPMYLGQDAKQRHQFSVNFNVFVVR